MYVRGVNSTLTKHSDYFVWKDTSERVTWCCEDTVDKKRVIFCVPQHLFLEGVEQPKKSPQNPQKYFFLRATHVTFSKFRGWSRKKNIWMQLTLQLSATWLTDLTHEQVSCDARIDPCRHTHTQTQTHVDDDTQTQKYRSTEAWKLKHTDIETQTHRHRNSNTQT